MMFCFAAGVFGSGLAPISMITGSAGTASTSSVNPWQAFLPVFIFSFIIAAIFYYIIYRSRWHGLKLAFAIFIAFYGLHTVVMQLESLVFLGSRLPTGMLVSIYLMGFIMAGLFAPLSVLIMHKTVPELEQKSLETHLSMPVSMWVWKIIVIGIAYVIIYYLFGYFIAWKNPAIQEYYSGHDPGNFFVHLANFWQSSPWMYGFQFIRGLLWMLFALPIIRMHKGGKWEVAFTVAIVVALWTFQLLIPNPMMPAEVARVHLIETFSSNFVFGWIVGFLLA